MSQTQISTITIYSPQTVSLTEYYGETTTRMYTYYTLWYITIYSHYNIVTTHISRYVTAITTYHVDPAGRVFSISISPTSYMHTLFSTQVTRFVSTRTDSSYTVYPVPM